MDTTSPFSRDYRYLHIYNLFHALLDLLISRIATSFRQSVRAIRSPSPVLSYPQISWSFPLFPAPPESDSSRLLASLWLLLICSASSSRRGGPVSTEHDHAETEMGLSFPNCHQLFVSCFVKQLMYQGFNNQTIIAPMITHIIPFIRSLVVYVDNW